MLREFETRRPQFDQLTQSAEGILSQTGDSAQDPKDLAEVRADLDSISEQWNDLTERLTQRSNNIDQAQGTSERYQVRPVRLRTDVLCQTSLLILLPSISGPAQGTLLQCFGSGREVGRSGVTERAARSLETAAAGNGRDPLGAGETAGRAGRGGEALPGAQCHRG